MTVDENPHRWRIRNTADFNRMDLSRSQRRGLHRSRKLRKRDEARREVKSYSTLYRSGVSPPFISSRLSYRKEKRTGINFIPEHTVE